MMFFIMILEIQNSFDMPIVFWIDLFACSDYIFSLFEIIKN